MNACSVCGNEYDKLMLIEVDGEKHAFDSFECAISALAPVCAHCKVRILGHGVEAGGKTFCCASCARHEGVRSLTDRAAMSP